MQSKEIKETVKRLRNVNCWSCSIYSYILEFNQVYSLSYALSRPRLMLIYQLEITTIFHWQLYCIVSHLKYPICPLRNNPLSRGRGRELQGNFRF